MAASTAAHGNMEHEDTAAILRLQIEDIEQLESLAKGKQREGLLSDFQAALDGYKNELNTYLRMESDRKMALSISRAVQLDDAIIRSLVEEEERATRDHQLALSLDEPGGEPCRAGESKATESPRAGPSGSGRPANDQPQGTPAVKVVSEVDCSACINTSAAGGIRCPCSHEYCRACLVELFQTSLRDRTLFPPRCCRLPIAVEDCRGLLGDELAGRFRAKKLELDTPNPTYCHDPHCSKFIPLQFVKVEVGTCVVCAKRTCVLCKAAAHAGDCPSDPRTNEFLDLAKKKGWVRCNSCKSMVELTQGCHHIICRCKAEFCYLCGKKWRQCACVMWHERRLLTRAQTIVDRDRGGAQGMAPRRREELINDQMRNQRQHHGCRNHEWMPKERHRFGSCEECHAAHLNFTFECRRCMLNVCQRCRDNRL